MTEKFQTIQEYKKALRKLAVDVEIIRGYGDLRKKQTWVNAYNALVTDPSAPQVQEVELPAKPRLSEKQYNLLFGPIEFRADLTGQFLLFNPVEIEEPPEPDDYPNDYKWHYQLWAEKYPEIAEANRIWAESLPPEPISAAPSTIIYCNGIFKPIIEPWEAIEFLPKKKPDPKLQKYFEDIEYIYPFEFLAIACFSWLRIEKIINATPEKADSLVSAETPRLPQATPTLFFPPNLSTLNQILPPLKLGKPTLNYWVNLPAKIPISYRGGYCGGRSPPKLKLSLA